LTEKIFISLLAASLAGTALFAVLLLASHFTKKHFRTSWHYYMWICVLAVMLIPVRISLPESISGDAPDFAVTTNHAPQVPTENSNAALQQNEAPSLTDTTYISPSRDLPLAHTVTKDTDISMTDRIISVLPIISVIWLCCAVILFSIKVAGYILFTRGIKKTTKFINLPQLYQYTQKSVTVGICGNISSPLLTGIIRPMLLLPDIDLNDEQIRNILSHEMTHLRRHDVLIKWFCIFVKCVHFYNPAVYFICKKIGEECEMSCDEAATKELDDNGKLSYVNTILALLPAGKSVRHTATTAMSGGKELLKKRFMLIKNSGNTGRKAVIVPIVIGVILIFCTILGTGIINGFTLPGTAKNDDTTKQAPVGQAADESSDDKNAPFIGHIKDESSDYIDIYTEKDGEYIMSIPLSVTDGFIAFEGASGWLDYFDIYCGETDDFMWAAVCTRPVMSSCTVALCTSVDKGKSWHHDSSQNIIMGIVDDITFTSDKDGVITYSGGGYGRGTSVTQDGGRTWTHSMEYGYSMPISRENAINLLRHQLIIAYEKNYGEYTPLDERPAQAVPDEEYLRYAIANLEVSKEDEDYYYIPVIWDFLVEKSTGRIFKFYDGLDKMLIPFDPYSPSALSFAG